MAATSTQAPWWTYPRIDNFGSIDPQGNYWKPDSNVQVPGNYPITALLSGIVTSVTNTPWGQNVVTVKLDQPLNNLATHTFYEHLSSTTVQVGQRVNQGTLIGYNNPSGQVPLGFGLYSGDNYGLDSAWKTLQNDLCPGCANLLNPTSLLNAAKSGSPLSSGSNMSNTSNTSSSGSSGSGSVCDTFIIGGVICSDWFEQSVIVTIGVLIVVIGLIALIVSSSKKGS